MFTTDRRLDLQTLFENILSSGNVYFQPPEDIKMAYPAIIFHWTASDVKFADNTPYHNTKRYEVTVVDEEPDSAIPGKIAALPMCTFVRSFAKDDLNHFIFNLYF